MNRLTWWTLYALTWALLGVGGYAFIRHDRPACVVGLCVGGVTMVWLGFHANEEL